MYGSLSAAAKDLNFPFSEAAFGHRKDESELQRAKQMSSSLLQYRSALGSLLGYACQELLVTEGHDGEIRNRPSSGGGRRNLQFPPPATAAVEIGDALQQNGGFTSAHSPYQSQQQQHTAAMEAEEMASGRNVGGGTNFVRQSSSPAGFFPHLKVDKECQISENLLDSATRLSLMKSMAAGFKGQIGFSGRQKLLSQISEMGRDGVSGGCDAESQVEISNSKCYIHGYPISWENSSLIWDNLAACGSGGLTRGINVAAAAAAQDGGLRSQFSLPNTSLEMVALQKLLQFQDTVPCKIRARRGCATHPRSIAERMRRSRISERMRKLQELVPNMDKQTNTSDMLDFAVDYIKDLQRQVKSLTERRASCTCSAKKQRTIPNTAN